jgi:hypothetical protein
MSEVATKSRRPRSRILGTKAFAAITAVEGLRLSAASRARLDTMKAAGLTAEQRRAEVLRAYTGLGKKKK